MRHLVRSGSHLLHHEQRQPHETKAVTEILQHDSTAHEPHALGLQPGQEGIHQERNVKDAAKREQGPLQASFRDIIAGQQRTQQEGRRTASAIVQADLLVAKAQTARSDIRLQEQRIF